MMDKQPAADTPVLSLELTDKEKLYRAYMKFVTGGGLFIPTTRTFALGDLIFLSLRLLDESEPHRLQAKIVWVVSQQSGSSQRGIGVQLQGKLGRTVREKIELALAGMLDSDKPTDTI